jgi:hypothetical protein
MTLRVMFLSIVHGVLLEERGNLCLEFAPDVRRITRQGHSLPPFEQ